MRSADFQQALWRECLAKGFLSSPCPEILAAFLACPRHCFVGQYRTHENADWRSGDLAEVYADKALWLAEDDSGRAASTCSQPSYILGLLQWLDVQHGQCILEVGSGSGWLLAMMAHLVGEAGRVTGVEILGSVAEASRACLHDRRNIYIHTGDGACGFPMHAPYDRIIFTAAQREVSCGIVNQLAPGGMLLTPLHEIGGAPTQASVCLYRRNGDELELLGTRPGYFVPLRGEAAQV